MAEDRNQNGEHEEPIIRDKRRIDPVTGKVRRSADESAAEASASAPASAGGDATDDDAAAGYAPGEADAESTDGDDYAAQERAAGIDGARLEADADAADGGPASGPAAGAGPAAEATAAADPDAEADDNGMFSDDDLAMLSGQSSAEQLAADRLSDLQRLTAEYANYRKRTEANRDSDRDRAVGDTVKGLLPVLDDVDRAEKHGDLTEGSAFATIATKLRASVQRLGVTPFGAVGDVFDPQVHEAIFQQPSPDVDVTTVLDVVETGYTIGSTLIRVAKVVVAVPEKG